MSKRSADGANPSQKRPAVLCAAHGVLTSADDAISVQLTDGSAHASIHVCRDRRCATCSGQIVAGDVVALRRSANGLRYDQLLHAACTQPHGAIKHRCECHGDYHDPCQLVPVSLNNGTRLSHVCATYKCCGCKEPIIAGSKLVLFETRVAGPVLSHESCAPPCHFCGRRTIAQADSAIHACQACRVFCSSCGHDITALSRRVPMRDDSWRCHGCAAKVSGAEILPYYCCWSGSDRCRDLNHPVTRMHVYDPISNAITRAVVCNKLQCHCCEDPLSRLVDSSVARLKTGELVCHTGSVEWPCFRECDDCGGGFIPEEDSEIKMQTLCRDCRVLCSVCGESIFDPDDVFGTAERALCWDCNADASSLDSGSDSDNP